MVMNVVTDLDGTLCDYSHRLAHLKSRNWDAFNKLCFEDKPIIPILDTVHALSSYGARIYVFTARPIDYYKQTKAWLKKYRVPFEDIFMRGSEDTRSDKAVKADFIKTFIEVRKEKIHLAIDDRLVIANLFREKGIVCLHARDGDDDYDSHKK
jgi:uncharacterized HAD superfamily protein